VKSIIKTNQPEVGHGIAIFDPTISFARALRSKRLVITRSLNLSSQIRFGKER